MRSGKTNGMHIFRILFIHIGMMIMLVITPSMATDRPEVNNPAIDALGEFLRSMNTLAGGKKVLPEGDPFLERVRTKYEIPDRIQIYSPHGGNEIIAMIFNSEHLPVVEGKWSEITPQEYKYLQSYHNLKAVYCLHEREPLDLGDVVVAVQHNGAGIFRIYFNDKKGAVGSALIHYGNSVVFSGSQYIFRPAAQRQ